MFKGRYSKIEHSYRLFCEHRLGPLWCVVSTLVRASRWCAQPSPRRCRVVGGMAPKSCALTNERSAFGKRKPKGECLMTKIATGVVERCEVTPPHYTQCKHCNLYVCVECWHCVAGELDKLLSSGRSIMPNDV